MLGVLLATLLAAATAGSSLDTVFLTNGGRARGTVIEDDPASGITLQLPDGTIRKYARAEVARVEFADQAGASDAPPAAPPPVQETPSSAPPQGSPPPPPYGYPPPPPMPPYGYPPAPPQQPIPAQPAPPPPGSPHLFTLSLGTGGAYTTGSVGGNLGKTADWWPGFMLFQLEAGARVSPALTLLLYVDGGGGDAARRLREECAVRGLDCGAGSVRVGIMARHAFTPAAPRTAWVALGTGFESTGVMLDGFAGEEFVSFDGWEALRLAAGIDFRPSQVFGVGLFAGFSLGTYSKVTIDGPAYVAPSELGSRGVHSWFQAGAKLILFP